MDNKINTIRNKISLLREDMLDLEAKIATQINRDEDCSENSFRLMAMRTEMLGLIRARNRFGVESIPAVPVVKRKYEGKTLRGYR